MRFPYQKPLALFLGLSIVCLSGCAAADAALPVSMAALRRVCADAQAKTPGLKIDYLP